MSNKTPPATEFPLPELFWPDEGEPEPMKAPIATVSVFALGKSGEREQIDYTTLDALPNTNALRDAYGPGMFEIQGRAASGAIVAKKTLRVALRPGQQWRPPSAHGAELGAPPAMTEGGKVDPMAMIVRAVLERGQDPTAAMMLQHVLSLSTQMTQQSNESNARIVEAISSLAGARITDQQELFQTLMKARPTGAASGSVADGVKAYEAGMAKIMEFIDQFQAGGGDGGGDGETSETELLKTLIESFRAAKGDPENVVPMKKTQGKKNAG